MFGVDGEILDIFIRSMEINFIAALVAVGVGFPMGAAIGLSGGRLAFLLRVIARGFLGFPPVVVGLVVYLALSRDSVLGFLGLLYTLEAIIIAQVIIVLPIGVALTEEAVRAANIRYAPELRALGIDGVGRIFFILYEIRGRLGVVFFTCFGRALSEVGAALVVGGNIIGSTRIMTTAIATETSRGNTDAALMLGLLLVVTSVALHLLITVGGFKRAT